MMSRSFLRVSLLTLPLFLAGCGEGWEAQKTSTYLPYGNERTAGSGVVYVRAQLLPKKDLNLEPELVKPSREPEPVPPEPVEEVQTPLDAEEIFNDAQSKIKSSKSAHSAKHDEASIKTPVVTEKHAVLETKSSKIDAHKADVSSMDGKSDEDHVPLGSPEDALSVDLLEEAPKTAEVKKEAEQVIENQSLDFESGLMESELSPEAGDVLEEVVTIEVEDRGFAERALRQPIKELVVPKRDTTSILSVGQETLNEIYNSPF